MDFVFQGLGRRRVPNSTYNFKQDFITWMPEREYAERSRPLASTYKVDYNEANKNQLFIKRPKTSFEGKPITTYRYAHGDESPNKRTIDAMNNNALKLSLLNRKDKPMSGKNSYGRESVASCLTWVSYKSAKNDEPVRPNIPAATQTTVYEPHPPPAQRPPSPITPPRITQHAWPSPDAPPPLQLEMREAPPPPVQAPPHPQPEPMAQW